MNQIRKNWSISILLLLVIIISGSISKAQEPITIKIPDPKKFSSDIEEFIIDKSYLPLETNPDCLMPGQGGEVFFYKDLIFIHFGGSWGTYIFTKNGEFVNHINPIGYGPNECVSIYSIRIYNDLLYLFDRRGGKIVVVDFEGRAQKVIKTPLYPYDIIHNNEGQLLMHQNKELYEGKPYEIVGYDEKRQKFFGYMPAGHLKESQFRNFRIFYRFGQKVVMAVTACDTIFDISGSASKPLYILDYGKRGLTNTEKRTFSSRDIRGSNKPKMIMYQGWQQAGNMVSFLYHTETRYDNLLFYNFDNNKFYGGIWLNPKIEFGQISFPRGTTEDSFVFLKQAITVIEEAEEHPDRCSPALLKIAKQIDPNDNPVIMFWRVK